MLWIAIRTDWVSNTKYYTRKLPVDFCYAVQRHHRRGKTAENQETDELNAFVDQEAENAGRSDKFKSKAKLAYAEMSAFVGKNLFPLALVMVGTLIGTFFVIRRNRKSDQSL
ncbi:MAG: hypothetical protein EBZ49_11170 [Proteobacteria bacterium]|nr:hypothetical protein [Pseudomonadota bacterium]